MINEILTMWRRFQENDTITLIQKIDDNWYEGSVNGRTGYFPVTYVQVVNPLP